MIALLLRRVRLPEGGAYAGVEACPRPPHWAGAPLFGGVHVVLAVV